jgi:hypothetical protein
VQVELQLKVGNRYVKGSAVPKEFLDFGVRGIQAFAYAKGMDVVNAQLRKGNELAGFFVDGRQGTSPEMMRKNYRWEFSQGGSNMVAAIEEALSQLASLSNSYGARSTGRIASSWAVYVNGVKSSPEAAGKAKRGDDIRITSDEAYARFLEAGNWSGTESLVKRSKRAVRISEGKRVRARVNITKRVANSLSRKYKSLVISDVWYEQNPFGYSFGKDQRWPAIKFLVRRNLNG